MSDKMKVGKVQIGHSNVSLFPIGIGTNAVGGHNLYPNLDEEVGKDLVRTALTKGIQLIDTAFIYGNGRSEELIGQVIKEFDRQDIVIATKAAHRYVNNQVVLDNSPSFLTKSVDDALQRLQTDYIDIFYIHFPDDHTPKDEAVAALQKVKQTGKIKAIGVSNFSLAQLKEANKHGWVDVVQDEYNLLNRQNEQHLFPYCVEHGISFIPYFPLASGLLTGKYHEDVTFPAGDLRNEQDNFKGQKLKANLEKVSKLSDLAKKYHVEITHVVLAWYLARPEITAIIPGAKTAHQVEDNLRVTSFHLTKDEVEFIDNLFS